jgi:DNA polymerase epsilon subunit 1
VLSIVVIISDYTFEVRVEIDIKQVYKALNKLLSGYKEEKRGPTVVVVQSDFDFPTLLAGIPAFADFPMIPIHISDSETLYSVLDWQRVGAKVMLNHFLKFPAYLQVKYLHFCTKHHPNGMATF